VRFLHFALVLAALIAIPHAADAAAAKITLPEALARARDADPGLAAAGARIDAARANVDQAGRIPNPSVTLQNENFAGTGSMGGFDRSETTLSYAQPIEIGGQRGARRSVASWELRAAQLRQQIRFLDLCKAVEVAWVEALAAQQELALAQRRVATAERLRAETERRVNAARDPAFAAARVRALATQAQISLGQARANADATRAVLASYWRGGPNFELDPGPFMILGRGEGPANESPDIALLEAERSTAGARVNLEEARSIQDPKVEIGVRRFNFNDEYALIAGVTIPLPIFDDNSGNIARARAERVAAERDVVSLQIARDRDIEQLRARIAAAATEASRLQTGVIPEAERSLSLARAGFNRGAFSYLDVVESERALADARARLIAVLKAGHLDEASLHRLTGRFLSLIVPAEISDVR
jgi:cobalt-zinc-cadmium efflux system outer membrane protein